MGRPLPSSLGLRKAMPLHRSMRSVWETRLFWSAPPRRGSVLRTMPLASCEQPRKAVPMATIPCQLVASASRCSAAPGSQSVEWSARGRARVVSLSHRPGSSSPNPKARSALQGHIVAGGGVRVRSGSSCWPGRAACLSFGVRLLPSVGRVAVKSPSPNQSLEPTRVGKPPLAAQLQR